MDPIGTLSVHLMIDSALLKHKNKYKQNSSGITSENTNINTLQVKIQTQIHYM